MTWRGKHHRCFLLCSDIHERVIEWHVSLPVVLFGRIVLALHGKALA